MSILSLGVMCKKSAFEIIYILETTATFCAQLHAEKPFDLSYTCTAHYETWDVKFVVQSARQMRLEHVVRFSATILYWTQIRKCMLYLSPPDCLSFCGKDLDLLLTMR